MGFKLAELFVAISTNGEGKVFSTLDSIKSSLLGIGPVTQAALAMFDRLWSSGERGFHVYRKAFTAQQQLQAVLRANGQAAGFNAEQLISMADALEKVTNFDRTNIVGAMTRLAMNPDVQGKQYTDAIKASLDLAAQSGQDLVGVTMRVGRAMQDPLMGANQLRRLQVQITDAEKDKIKALMKSNDLVAAQGVLMGAINRTASGAAKEITDPVVMLHNAWEDTYETIGKNLYPVIKDVLDTIREMLPTSDEIDAKWGAIAGTIRRVWDTVKPTLADWKQSVMNLKDVMEQTVSALGSSVASLFSRNGPKVKRSFADIASDFKYLTEYMKDNWEVLMAAMVASAEYSMLKIKHTIVNLIPDIQKQLAESTYGQWMMDVFGRQVVRQRGAAEWTERSNAQYAEKVQAQKEFDDWRAANPDTEHRKIGVGPDMPIRHDKPNPSFHLSTKDVDEFYRIQKHQNAIAEQYNRTHNRVLVHPQGYEERLAKLNRILNKPAGVMMPSMEAGHEVLVNSSDDARALADANLAYIREHPDVSNRDQQQKEEKTAWNAIGKITDKLPRFQFPSQAGSDLSVNGLIITHIKPVFERLKDGLDVVKGELFHYGAVNPAPGETGDRSERHSVRKESLPQFHQFAEFAKTIQKDLFGNDDQKRTADNTEEVAETAEEMVAAQRETNRLLSRPSGVARFA